LYVELRWLEADAEKETSLDISWNKALVREIEIWLAKSWLATMVADDGDE
jgi:hypothetical protein